MEGIVICSGKTHTTQIVEEGLVLLKQLDIIPEHNSLLVMINHQGENLLNGIRYT